MQIQMRNNRIAVETLKREQRQSAAIVTPEDATTIGIIRHTGPETADDLKVGQKVFFGDHRHKARIAGKELEIMEESNIFAVVANGDDGEVAGSKSA